VSLGCAGLGHVSSGWLLLGATVVLSRLILAASLPWILVWR
jgi:hypothetical protein